MSDLIEPRVCQLGMCNSRPQVKGNEDSGKEAVDCTNLLKSILRLIHCSYINQSILFWSGGWV